MADDTGVLKEEAATPAGASVTSASEPPKPRYKTRRFWIRCGIICTVIVVVLVAILVPVLLLVAFPQIAQGSISGSSLNFQTINITNPANESFIMHVVGGVSNAGPIGASIHFASPVQVFWNNSILLGNLTMSDLSVSGGSGSIDSNAQFTVLNTSGFTEFNAFLLGAESFTWRILGTVSVSALGRTASGLTLDKTVNYGGMAGFPGIEILNLTLPITQTPSQGVEMDIIVSMNNPSPLGIQLGDLNLNLTYNGTILGPATVSNFFLASGLNKVPIKAILLAQPTAEGSARVTDLLSKYLSGAPAETLGYGISTYPDGKNSIAWLTPAIQSLVLKVDLKAPSDASLNDTARNFAQSSINGASLAFNTVNITSETETGFTSSLDVFLNNTGPLPATIQFPDPVQIYYNGSLLGTVVMPSVDVTGGSGHLLGPNSNFAIVDPSFFGAFTKLLLSAKSFEWRLVGNATAVALNRTFSGLSLDKTVTLQGMDSFQNIQVQKFSLPGDVSAAAGGGIEMDITALMQNLSPIGVQLGTLNLNVTYQGVFLGPVAVQNFFLASGNNIVQMSGKMVTQTDQAALTVISELFSAYIAGQTLQTVVQGVNALPDGTTTVSWLEPGIQSLTLTVPLNNQAGATTTTTTTTTPTP